MRKALVRPEKPRNPVAFLKEKALEGEQKAARALARGPGAAATDEEGTDTGRQPKEPRGDPQGGQRGRDGAGGSGIVPPDNRVSRQLMEERQDLLRRAAELQRQLDAEKLQLARDTEQQQATRAMRRAEMAEQAEPGAGGTGAHDVRRDIQVGRYVTHGGNTACENSIVSLVRRDRASLDATPLPCSREGWESPGTERTQSDADLAQALLDDLAPRAGDGGDDGDGRSGSPTGRGGGAAGREGAESSLDLARSRVADSGQGGRS